MTRRRHRSGYARASTSFVSEPPAGFGGRITTSAGFSAGATKRPTPTARYTIVNTLWLNQVELRAKGVEHSKEFADLLRVACDLECAECAALESLQKRLLGIDCRIDRIQRSPH